MISIICVYNNDKILNECLKESLQLQKQIEYETIFVDSRKYKFHSAAEALNYAGNLANGEYLIFCDADDLVQGRERGDLTASYAAAAAVDAGALRRHF